MTGRDAVRGSSTRAAKSDTVVRNEHIPTDLRDRIRRSPRHRYGDFRSPQHLVLGQLQIGYRQPTSYGRTDKTEIFWLVCRLRDKYA